MSNMDELIEKIKEIMINVSTGTVLIQDINDAYKRCYKELDELYSINGIKNPNDFSDLWEFYNYWSKKLPGYASRRAYVIALYKKAKSKGKAKLKLKGFSYVSPSRISELKQIKSNDYDLTKLVQYCKELNTAFDSESYLSVAMLLRSIINHIPPIFGFTKFNEVVNSYKGTKSFKDSISKLESSSRSIADSYLHTLIRKKEVLPNSNQVDFSNDLDVLLSEIVRILK